MYNVTVSTNTKGKFYIRLQVKWLKSILSGKEHLLGKTSDVELTIPNSDEKDLNNSERDGGALKGTAQQQLCWGHKYF